MLLAALARHCGLGLGEHDVHAAAVGGIAATEPAADLAIALAIASDRRDLALPTGLCAIGEVSLSGDVRRVTGIERRLADAARLGFTRALVPLGRSDDPVPHVAGIHAVPVSTLVDAVTLGLQTQRKQAPRVPLRAVVPAGS
jgi:DNA repair protein RadA/Sms